VSSCAEDVRDPPTLERTTTAQRVCFLRPSSPAAHLVSCGQSVPTPLTAAQSLRRADTAHIFSAHLSLNTGPSSYPCGVRHGRGAEERESNPPNFVGHQVRKTAPTVRRRLTAAAPPTEVFGRDVGTARGQTGTFRSCRIVTRSCSHGAGYDQHTSLRAPHDKPKYFTSPRVHVGSCSSKMNTPPYAHPQVRKSPAFQTITCQARRQRALVLRCVCVVRSD
jgi:hypothetical protein